MSNRRQQPSALGGSVLSFQASRPTTKPFALPTDEHAVYIQLPVGPALAKLSRLPPNRPVTDFGGGKQKHQRTIHPSPPHAEARAETKIETNATSSSATATTMTTTTTSAATAMDEGDDDDGTPKPSARAIRASKSMARKKAGAFASITALPTAKQVYG